MKIKLFMVWFLLATASPSTGQLQRHPSESPTVHIKGQGCLKPGNVPGCVVVNDFGAHRKYNLFFLNNKPELNTGISFEGLGYSHTDSRCKQGQKVQVTEWKPFKGECPQRSPQSSQ